jgi:hypothetical protein
VGKKELEVSGEYFVFHVDFGCLRADNLMDKLKVFFGQAILRIRRTKIPKKAK